MAKPTWITINPTSGNGDKSISVTASQNTGNSRSGNISTSGKGITKTVNISQKNKLITEVVTSVQSAVLGSDTAGAQPLTVSITHGTTPEGGNLSIQRLVINEQLNLKPNTKYTLIINLTTISEFKGQVVNGTISDPQETGGASSLDYFKNGGTGSALMENMLGLEVTTLGWNLTNQKLVTMIHYYIPNNNQFQQPLLSLEYKCKILQS